MGQKFRQNCEQNEQYSIVDNWYEAIDAIKLETVPLDKIYPKETVLSEDVFYRYLYQPGEQHGDQKRWAIDVEKSGDIWRHLKQT